MFAERKNKKIFIPFVSETDMGEFRMNIEMVPLDDETLNGISTLFPYRKRFGIFWINETVQ